MKHAHLFFTHRIFFIFLALSLLFLPSLPSSVEVILGLLLFFGLGIPHGALDVPLGRLLFEPKFGKFWWIVFILAYCACLLLIVFLWFVYPLPSFLFFLMIAALHFGFSDTEASPGLFYYLEGIGRGLLPICAPAYFYPNQFQKLVESSLHETHAIIVQQIVYLLFYPDFFLLLVLVFNGLYRATIKSLASSAELTTLFLLFMALPPFKAFILYFCFLHAMRHILTVVREMHLPLDSQSVKWVILQSLPATFMTLLALSICYLYFKQNTIDTPLMFNLFFMSLAALTFPHMLLTEGLKMKRALQS